MFIIIIYVAVAFTEIYDESNIISSKLHHSRHIVPIDDMPNMVYSVNPFLSRTSIHYFFVEGMYQVSLRSYSSVKHDVYIVNDIKPVKLVIEEAKAVPLMPIS